MRIKEKLKSKKVRNGIIVAILITVAGGFIAYSEYKNSEPIEETQVNIEMYSIPESEKIFINGVVIPTQVKDFSIGGEDELSNINVDNGQVVSKGDLLYTCKNNSALAEIENLNIQIEELEKQKSQSVEGMDTQMLDIEINKLKASVSSLNKKAYTKVTAPFDGKVYLNDQSEGMESASSFMTLQSNEFYMKGQASEQDLPKMKVDQGVSVLVFSTNKKVDGYISYISDRPSTNVENAGTSQGSLSYYDVNIKFNNQENLVNGFHVQATVKVENSIYKVPSTAILKDEDKYYVLKDMDGIIKKQVVEIQERHEDYSVVKAGLKENDIIIKYPSEEMKEGDVLPTDNVSYDKEVGM